LKNKINIFSDKKIEFFLSELFSDYELSFITLDEIESNILSTRINVIFLNSIKTTESINFGKLSEDFIVFSNFKNKNLSSNNKFIKTPISINHIKTIIENLIENLKIRFHDITILNEKLTNIKNNSFCYLTKSESEILTHLVVEKESTKKYIQENILNIKSTVQTNSLDSHLTRIRKKMYQIKTSVKILSKNEKLSIIV